MSGYVYLSNGEPLANEHGVIYLAHSARAERTCTVEESSFDELWNEKITRLSCGHYVWGYAGKYCPECGAKVVDA